MSNAAKARAILAWFSDLREATDLLAAGLRGPLHKITLGLISVQATFAAARSAGLFDAVLANHVSARHLLDTLGVWVGLVSTVVALYTQRKGEAASLIEAKRRATSDAMQADKEKLP
jgi:hypothetical protein